MLVKLRNKLSVIIPIIIVAFTTAVLGTVFSVRSRIDTLQKQLNLLEMKLSTLTKESHSSAVYPLNSILRELPKPVADPTWSLLERQQIGNLLRLIATISPGISPEIKETLNNSQTQIADDINRFFELQNQLIDKLNNQTPVLTQNNIRLFSNIYLPIKIGKKINLPLNHEMSEIIVVLINKLQRLLYTSPQNALKQLSKLKQTLNLATISEFDELGELFSKYLDTPSVDNNIIDSDKI